MIALREAEQLVLGALLQTPRTASRAIGNLPSSAFADPANQALFWRLLIDDVQTDDAGLSAARLAVAPITSRERPAAVRAASRMIRSAWDERTRASTDSNLVELADWRQAGAA